MDLNKHIITNDTNKPFHSNGYAQIAVGNRVGSTSSKSFLQRQQIDHSRQIIKGYNRSAIGSSYGALRARPVSTGIDINRSMARLMPISRPVVSPSPRYNPFA